MNLDKIKIAYQEWCGCDLPEDCDTPDKVRDKITTEIGRWQDEIKVEGELICNLYLNSDGG